MLTDLSSRFPSGIRGYMVKADSFSSQANLLNACEDFVEPATRLANLAKASVPTIHDQSQALHLNNSSKQLTQALVELRTCLTRVPFSVFTAILPSNCGVLSLLGARFMWINAVGRRIDR